MLPWDLFCTVLLSISQPPVAPSLTSESDRDDFRQGLSKLLRDRNVVFLVISYGISQGVQEAIIPVLNLNIKNVGIKEVWNCFVILIIDGAVSLSDTDRVFNMSISFL